MTLKIIGFFKTKDRYSRLSCCYYLIWYIQTLSCDPFEDLLIIDLIISSLDKHLHSKLWLVCDHFISQGKPSMPIFGQSLTIFNFSAGYLAFVFRKSINKYTKISSFWLKKWFFTLKVYCIGDEILEWEVLVHKTKGFFYH